MKRILLFFLLLLPATQRIDAAELFKFVDESGGVHSVTDADLAKLPRKTAKVSLPDNQTAEFEGVELLALLQQQGVALGKELRGARVANYLLLEAEDRYRVVVALAEVDPAVTNKTFLLADRKNGGPLPEKERPLRLVIPDEKRPVRWIRMINKISVRNPAADEAKP